MYGYLGGRMRKCQREREREKERERERERGVCVCVCVCVCTPLRADEEVRCGSVVSLPYKVS